MNSITSYSNQIAAQPSAAQNALPAVSTAPEQAPQQVVRSDAEVVSNVASTEIKPSNVSQAAQPRGGSKNSSAVRVICAIHGAGFKFFSR